MHAVGWGGLCRRTLRAQAGVASCSCRQRGAEGPAPQGRRRFPCASHSPPMAWNSSHGPADLRASGKASLLCAQGNQSQTPVSTTVHRRLEAGSSEQQVQRRPMAGGGGAARSWAPSTCSMAPRTPEGNETRHFPQGHKTEQGKQKVSRELSQILHVRHNSPSIGGRPEPQRGDFA